MPTASGLENSVTTSPTIDAWEGIASGTQLVPVLPAWDRVRLGGKDLPGLARVRGKLSRKVDVKHAPERFGATLTDLGVAPAQFQIVLRLWTPDHLNSWELFAPFLAPPPNKRNPKPIEVEYPSLILHGIRRVYVVGIGLLEETQVAGVWQTTLDCLEWRPASPAEAVTPTSAGIDLTATPNVAARTPQARGASEP